MAVTTAVVVDSTAVVAAVTVLVALAVTVLVVVVVVVTVAVTVLVLVVVNSSPVRQFAGTMLVISTCGSVSPFAIVPSLWLAKRKSRWSIS